jgi:hypothetical protein
MKTHPAGFAARPASTATPAADTPGTTPGSWLSPGASSAFAAAGPGGGRPPSGTKAARMPARRASPVGRGPGAHLPDDPGRADHEEFDRSVPTPLAATLLQLPGATSALLDHDLNMRPDPLAFHLVETLDPNRRKP